MLHPVAGSLSAMCSAIPSLSAQSICPVIEYRIKLNVKMLFKGKSGHAGRGMFFFCGSRHCLVTERWDECKKMGFG